MLGTVFAGTPPWPLIMKTGCVMFIDVPLEEDPTLRKLVNENQLMVAQYIKQWPGSTAADVWRGLGLNKRDDAMRFIQALVRTGYLRYEHDYHEITSLPIRRYFYIEE
jgi:hypothetical protein